MPESLTRKKCRQPHKRRPASNRNGGRLQLGTLAGFKSEYPAGLNRNLQLTLFEKMPMQQALSPTHSESDNLPTDNQLNLFAF